MRTQRDHMWDRPAPEPKNEDLRWRTPPAIDIDRILYAPEFRRLEGVTQVRSPQDDYVYHDRLTHSMKVAQVAMRLAEKLLADHKDKKQLDCWLNPRVCYAAGLAHDLGHPPYGHTAEEELQLILEEENVLDDSFEGNAQTFRIVTRSSLRKKRERNRKNFREAFGGSYGDVDPDGSSGFNEFDEADGLNLTWRTLAAISKYAWPKGKGPSKNPKLDKKWGFYDTEEKYYNFMREKGYIHPYGDDANLKQSLEAQVMDWSDDITYAVHDIEDYFRGQAISLERLFLEENKIEDIKYYEDKLTDEQILLHQGTLTEDEWLDLFNFVYEYVGKNVRDSWTRNLLQISQKKVLIDFCIIRNMLPSTPFTGGRESHDTLRSFGSHMISSMQDGVRQDGVSVELAPECNNQYYLNISEEAQLRAAILKAIFKYYVVLSPSTVIMQQGQKAVIRELYHGLTDLCIRIADSANFLDKISVFEQLPARLREYFIENLEKKKDEGYDECFGEKAVRQLKSEEREVSAVEVGKGSKRSTLNCNDLKIERKKIASRPVIDFICTLTDKQATLLHQRLTGDNVGTLSPYWLNV